MKTLKQELMAMKASKDDVEDEMSKLRSHYEERLAGVDGSTQQSKTTFTQTPVRVRAEFLFTAYTSFTRTSGASVVTCTST